MPVNPAQPPIPPVPGFLEHTLTARQFTIGEKFQYRVLQQFGWQGLVGSAIASGITQGTNTPKEWGHGWGAYGKRYASSYGIAMTDQLVTFGLESALHEDPRYFPSSEKGFKARFGNVLRQALVVKKDDGHPTFAYARIGGAFASGFVANSWQPSSNNSAGDALIRGGLNLAGDAAFFCIQEFIPFTRNSHFRNHP